MAGCLRSAVPLALRSNLIETIGRLPGLFEKLLEHTVNLAPRGPNDSKPPDLLGFRVSLGAILIRLQKRKPIFSHQAFCMLSKEKHETFHCYFEGLRIKCPYFMDPASPRFSSTNPNIHQSNYCTVRYETVQY
jgi:hypothetical protein